ncbi:MAG TPA: HD domain-containing protein [Candidatus Baltobacteraceae bacterium]|nr:HD domain-containing protein [Candidatus Baltobacteraceae bacterium]
MASREYVKAPVPRSAELNQAAARWPLVERADIVAAVAHAAIGQRRADHVTPYIDHPRLAATLILRWNRDGVILLDDDALERCAAGALLHDVLEDTKLPRSELRAQFPEQSKLLALVERMTEPPGDPDAPEYYGRIGEDREAVIVKCADRCANLEDVVRDVRRGEGIDRWRRYLTKTQRDVLPILHDAALERELRTRIEEIEALLRTPAG